MSSQEMSRRKFFHHASVAMAGTAAASGGLAWALAEGWLQDPESTPESDPFAESDAANRQALTALDRENQDQIVLQSPMIVGYLEYRQDNFMAPDRDKFRAILADSQGVYGFASNIWCTIEFAEPYLGQAIQLPRTEDEFNVFLHPVEQSEDLPYGLRLDRTVGRAVGIESLPLEDGETTATHYALDAILHQGQLAECPDFIDQSKEFFGQARDNIQEGLAEGVDRIEEGAEQIGNRIRDWWNNR